MLSSETRAKGDIITLPPQQCGRQQEGSRERETTITLRGRRPQTCLETLCARTGRPQRRSSEEKPAGQTENERSMSPSCTRLGVTRLRSTGEGPEPRSAGIGGGAGGKAAIKENPEETYRDPCSRQKMAEFQTAASIGQSRRRNKKAALPGFPDRAAQGWFGKTLRYRRPPPPWNPPPNAPPPLPIALPIDERIAAAAATRAAGVAATTPGRAKYVAGG